MKPAVNTDDHPRPASGRPVQALTGVAPLTVRQGSTTRLPRLCSLRLSAALALAGCGLGGVTHAESFFLATRTRAIPEAGTVTNSVLCSSRHELAFQPPRGWKESFDTNNLQFTWISGDYASMVRLKISPSWQTPVLNTEELRQTVLERHPKAQIREQFTCYTTGGTGLAFDLEEAGDRQTRTSTRVAFVPSVAGLAEFTLVTPTEQVSKNQLQFSQFLNSFQVSPRSNR